MFTLASFTGLVIGWSLVSEKHANFVAYLFIFNERGGYSRLLQYSIGGGGVALWAKSGGEAFLLQFSDFTKDPMHDFNRLFCRNTCDCEF